MKQVSKLVKTRLFLVFCAIITIINLSKKILKYQNLSQYIQKTDQEIEYILEENELLTQKKEYYTNDEFIRYEAKQKLGLFKPNEKAIILPDFSDLSLLNQKTEIYENQPNYKKWWYLFFKS